MRQFVNRYRRSVSALLSISMAFQPLVAAAAGGGFAYQVPLEGRNQAMASAGQLTLNPGSHDFGTLVLGSAASFTTSVKNTGQEGVTITGFPLPAPYTQSNTCPAVLVGGASCNISVTYNPQTAGTFNGSLNVTTAEVGAQASFGIAGAAVVPTTNLTLSANSVDFADADVGTPAAAKSVTVTNAGNSPATVNGIGIAGSTEFNQSNDCGATLAPGAHCTIQMSFVPSEYGVRSAGLSIYEQASGTLYNVALAGSGNAAVMLVTPGSKDFGSAIANYSTTSGQVTVSNTGNLPMKDLFFDAGATDFSVKSTTCSASLAANASCTATVEFAPTATGARTANLVVHSTNAGTNHAALTGTGVAQAPSVKASVTSMAFGDIPMDAASASKSVTFTNTGNVKVPLSSLGLVAGAANFQATNTCPTVLDVGATCTASVVFAPRQSGALAGTLRAAFTSGALDVALSGTGTLGQATVSASSVPFADQQVASASAARTVTVTNTGNRTLTFSGVGIASGAADFSQTNDCSAVAPAGTCTLSIVFTPSAAGARSGTLALVHDGVGTTLIDLSGKGQAQTASLSTPSFGATAVNASSTAVATLRNTGIGALSVTTPSAASVTGSGYSFVSTSCGTSVAVGAACSVTVKFSPTSVAPATGNLNIDTGAGTQTASMGSTGIQGYASISPSSMTFAAQQVASTSATQIVTVTNTGTDVLTFTGVGVSAGASDFAQSNNCGAVAVGATCTVNVAFTPTVPGARAGTLAFAHNGGGLATVSLDGTGQGATATLSNPSFAATQAGSTATAVATLTNTGIGAISVATPGASSVTGTDFSFVSTTCGSSLAVAASCATTLKFAPTASSASTGTFSFGTEAGTKSVSLTATGLQGSATLSATTLAFGAKQIGDTSTPQTVTVTNNGTSALAFTGVTVSAGAADYSQTNTCSSVAVGGTCTVTVTFKPTASGSRPGSVTLTHNGVGATSFSLSGAGQAQSVSLSTPAFAATPVGSSSNATTTLSNTGIGAVGVTPPYESYITGAAFSFVSTTCGTTLAAGATCATTVKFSPTSTTAASGSLGIDTTAGRQTASLNSTGIQGYASVSPGTLTFATRQISTTSPVQAVTVTNTGTDTLTVSSVSFSAGAADYAQTNTCGAVPVNGTCTVSVSFTPTAAGSRPGTLTLTHNGGGATSVGLSATGQAQSATLSSPAFAATPVGSSSNAIATLTNTGIGALSVTVPSAGSVTGAGYSFVSTTCGTSVAVGANCGVTVKFSPTSTAASSGTLSVATGAGTQSSGLGSTGIQGYANVSPGSLSFAARQTSTTSAVQTVTVTNTGTNTLTFTGVGISAGATDYAQSNNCGAVAVNGTCTVSVTFTPSAAGTRTGTLAFTHDGGGIATVSLSGTGQWPSASMSTPSFPATPVGASNNADATLTNTGIGAITVTVPSAASVTGAGFSFVSTTCGTSLAAGGTCVTTVKFSATSTAAMSGTLAVATGAGTQSVTLSSTGIQGYASVNPSSLTYGTYGMWTTSPVQTVTVTNTGTNTLTFSGVGISAGSSDFAQSNNCGAVAVNSTCTVNVTFSPSTGGTRTGTLSFTHNGGGLVNVSLSGTGQGPSGYLTMGAFPTTTVGSSSTAVATYVNTGIGPAPTGVPSAASVTGNAAFSFVSTNCTGSVPVNSSCSTTIRFSPTSPAAATGNFAINDWNQWHNATLSATGIQGNASFSAANIGFGDRTVGTSSAAQSVTVTNNGSNTLTISGVAVTAGGGDYGQTNTCSSPLAVNASCTISVWFAPSGTGVRGGTVTVTHNGTGQTSIGMGGNGVTAPSVTGASFSPSTVTTGNGSTFSWTTANASSASVSCSGPAAGSSSGTSGSLAISTSGTGTGYCTVTAYNTAGTSSAYSAPISVVAAPYVATASFSPSTVTSGYGSTFSWSTGNATSASVSCSGPAAGSSSGTSGSLVVSTSSTGTGYCTVTAYNAAGNSSAYSAPISVVAAPWVATASFSPSTVTSGYGSTFSWSTGGATSASVSCSGPAAGSGSGTSGSFGISTSGTGTGYCTVTAYNAAGQSSAYSAPISVVAAPYVATASFSPSTVTTGYGSTFSWSTGNATSASVSCSGPAAGSSSGTSGSLGVSTSSTGTGYCTVTAYNAAGQSSAYSAPISVVAAPYVATASFSPSTVTTGYGSTFSWSTGGATSASVSCSGPAAGSSNGTSGSVGVSTSGTGTGYCTVTAYNDAGNSAAYSAPISVVAAPYVATASFSPSAVTSGAGSTFSWSTGAATSASVACSGPAAGSGSGTSGSIAVSTSSSGTGYCTVTAYNAAGNSAAYSAGISVAAPAVGTFAAAGKGAQSGSPGAAGYTWYYDIKNTGSGTISGISATLAQGYSTNAPTTIAPGATVRINGTCSWSGCYGQPTLTLTGSNVTNSGFTY